MSPEPSGPGALTAALFLRRPILRSQVPSALSRAAASDPSAGGKRQERNS